ncbi:MAG: DUF2493 domain-containing protein [Hydrotalea sp. AMD]|uniref:DUF2493 domain-containing protein n=1 Tax=Hydrotalea sp. AMD TaxID=2501297 RepID=UPI001025CFEE|nr:DUF2493 domain-containing protein [Hydrotalea sp. AMD]RWZ87189.1 MAG: DUF2493 domain-containing protein [Hydrotalea sp. AMD]
MRTIIAGSRNFNDYELLCAVIESCPWEITTIVSGKARGADSLGEKYAKDNDIPVDEFPANWNLHGKGAGPIRNQQMAENAEALIVLWDGISTGTKDMISRARKSNLKIMIYIYTTGKLVFN